MILEIGLKNISIMKMERERNLKNIEKVTSSTVIEPPKRREEMELRQYLERYLLRVLQNC